MRSLALVLAALCAPATHGFAIATLGLDSHSTHLSESVTAEPGFTWCYEQNMGPPCVNAGTPPDQCINVGLADNDKASSARTNANSYCTFYKHGNCVGETLEIGPLQTINKFSDYKFDNLMSAYRCKWVVKPPTDVTCNILVTDAVTGTSYGYISHPSSPYGFYGPRQSAQTGALTVSFSYSESAPRQLNLRALNGPTAASTYPFLGATFDYLPEYSMGPGHSELAELVGTGETPAGGPQVDSSANSVSARAGYPLPMESALWRFDPSTQFLTAQWINRDGGQPQTTIVLCVSPFYLIVAATNARNGE
ncbi:hypothetical protein B0H17DRAFT_1246153 [Mycena rosella]|uniref:Uncharacterized protein n=1 Tax=Mycena rosella TaxID=1033263 RepID=A0AAD7CYP0_MYCRO|nr:hypothetical protein B0H17DRAFT_1246153 [Mycena rosella]